jgi:predicted transposase YbfD/YdcC
LLSAVSQQLRVTLAQVPVGAKSNEIPAFQTLVEDLVLDGRLVTVDALLCQRAIAATVLQKGGTT